MRRRLADVLLRWAGRGRTTTVEVEVLHRMSGDVAALAGVRGVLIGVGPGAHGVDDLRAE